MNRMTLENLPHDVKETLPEEGQHLFLAAYNSFLDNSKDEAAAARVAWQTIERNEHYYRDQGGKWHRMEQDREGKKGALGTQQQS